MASFFTKAMFQITTVNNPEGVVVLSNRPLNDWIKNNNKLCDLCDSKERSEWAVKY